MGSFKRVESSEWIAALQEASERPLSFIDINLQQQRGLLRTKKGALPAAEPVGALTRTCPTPAAQETDM